ncbi:MAG: ISNCY family transposase [Thermodesulfovibrionales bacterium]
MAGKDIIMVRQKDLRRLHVIHKVMEGELTQVEASEILSLSDRQIGRIVKRIKEEGDKGIQHRSRGRESSRRLPKKLKDRVVAMYLQKYKGFGPTFTTEKLYELDAIELSKETVRKWLIEAGQWQRGRKSRTHRQWRERKWHCGEMVQMDGSHHDWFAGRRSKCVLMGYIDDATGRIFCRFYEYEGTIPAMDSFKRYIRAHGIPMSVYFDKHTTYKSTAEPSIEDEINGTEPLSEFGRALQELGVELIHAHSPQAKGRVERMFNTLQDRLVKEMTLRGINTIEEANRYLKSYLSSHNKRFAVKPKEQNDLHREISKGLNLDKILCIRTERTMRNDSTIAHKGKLYQIQESVKSKKVLVQERVNGKMLITHKDVSLKFKEITTRPEKQPKPARTPCQRIGHTPSSEHPWRKSNSQLFNKRQNRQKKLIEVAA